MHLPCAPAFRPKYAVIQDTRHTIFQQRDRIRRNASGIEYVLTYELGLRSL
jgi:hypothetical protein